MLKACRCLSLLLLQAYDMKRPLELPQEYGAMKEVLEREETEEVLDRNAWKRDEWQNGEDAGAERYP